MTSFSAAYSQLSQYLKEQQRLAVTRPTTTVSLLTGLPVPPETEAHISDQQTMDLLPEHTGLGLAAPEEEKSQLTIFYGGKVLVFDDFPADKAKDLMLMAGKCIFIDPPAAVPAIGGKTALPFARRASRNRFIEKRRERICTSKAWYQKVGSPAIRTYLPWFLNSLEAPEPALLTKSLKM